MGKWHSGNGNDSKAAARANTGTDASHVCGDQLLTEWCEFKLFVNMETMEFGFTADDLNCHRALLNFTTSSRCQAVEAAHSRLLLVRGRCKNLPPLLSPVSQYMPATNCATPRAESRRARTSPAFSTHRTVSAWQQYGFCRPPVSASTAAR